MTIVKRLVEEIAKPSSHKLLDNPISKAHFSSHFVIVWWYDRISGVVSSVAGRDFRHRNLSDFPGAADFKSPVRGRMFTYEGKVYNCIYEELTHYLLSDLTLKLQSEYGKKIDYNIDSFGYELEKL